MTCHSCGTTPAHDRRCYGWLCAKCWTEVIAIVRRICGKPDDWWPTWSSP